MIDPCPFYFTQRRAAGGNSADRCLDCTHKVAYHDTAGICHLCPLCPECPHANFTHHSL